MTAPNVSFEEWFCLNNRSTFTVDPKVNKSDAKLYFGRASLRERIKKQLSRAFVDPRVPKMMFFGAYGSGKTQTLFHMGWDLVENKPAACTATPNVVYLDIEVQSKSGADSWHLQMCEALGQETVKEWIATLYSSAAVFSEAVLKITPDPNIQRAFDLLRGGGDQAFSAWRWLTGYPLSTRELQDLKVTRKLGDVGVGDYVAALTALGNLAKAVGKVLVFCIDEMEGVQNIRQGDAAESWHDFLRKLSDNSNSTVGFVLGFMSATIDDAPRILIREDILSRIGNNNVIELEPLAAPQNVKTFVEDLLNHLVKQPAAEEVIKSNSLPVTVSHFPFTDKAFDLLCDYACQDPRTSTPRNIIRCINECAITAWDQNPRKRFVDDAIVNEVAPVIFS